MKLRLRWRSGIIWFMVGVAPLLPQAALMHGLSHAFTPTHQATRSASMPQPAQSCEQCLLYVALGDALPAQRAQPTLVRCEVPSPPARVVTRSGVACAAYIARAPPAVG